MQITIKLYASFCIGRFKSEIRTYSTPPSVSQIADELGIPVKSLGIVLRNGVHASREDIVADGDTVSLMPQMGGG
jgi:molybdopterin converting factor small subunit